MKRKQLSTRTRFEVFKRDGFTCQYCGRKPPAVILHADHIRPVADGGGNEMENLVSSCEQCNMGKSDVPLGRILIPKLPDLAVERERLEQLKAYQEFLSERESVQDIWFKMVSDKWIAFDGKDPDEWRICDDREIAVRTFLKRMPVQEILEALDIARARIRPPCNDSRFLRFFCGICWKKIRDAEGTTTCPKDS